MDSKLNWKKGMWKYVAPIVLAIYPYLFINRGVDYTDSMYSPANFLYLAKEGSMWNFATYLANFVGMLLQKLPFGDTYLGIRIYCTATVSIMAVISYYFFVKKCNPLFIFLSECMAIGLCWCPTTILYNYLTYLFLLSGAICLYQGVCKEKTVFLVASGILLGANVLVRFPNITQMALIVALWWYGFLEKKSFGKIVRETLLCVAGYLLGIGVILGIISVQFGFSNYVNAILGLFNMSDTASGYKPTEMILTLWGVFWNNRIWIFLVFMAVILSTLYILIFRNTRFGKCTGKPVVLIGCGVMLAYFYHAGMFNFKFDYTYTSIYQWCVVYFVISVCLFVVALFRKEYTGEEKMLVMIALIIMAISPLGSNTNIFPLINNLFIVAPVSAMVMIRILEQTRKKPVFFPTKALYFYVAGMLFIQSIGFSVLFQFRDGYAMDGITKEKIDTKIENNGILKGMYTTSFRRDFIEGLTEYVEQSGIHKENGCITFGNIPGVHYFLAMKPAISTAWPDLDSYTLFETDLRKVEEQIRRNNGGEKPVVIITSLIEACIRGDQEAMDYHRLNLEQGEVTVEKVLESEKIGVLETFLKENGYEKTYSNNKFVVYE